MKRKLLYFTMLVLLIAALAGCKKTPKEPEEPTATQSPSDEAAAAYGEFSYSEGLDENGFWVGIKASDYVPEFDYEGIVVPSDSTTVEDAELMSAVESALYGEIKEESKSTDRAAADGDAVNITYVGSVGGVEFEGGATGEDGANIIIGYTSYIDNFLEQLIGHMPGETFDVNVTFPEDYGNEELNGQAAVFVTTINYIINIDEIKEDARKNYQKGNVQSFIRTYLSDEITVDVIPDSLMEYQNKAFLKYYYDTSKMYGMSWDDLLSEMGAATTEELLESNKEANTQNAKYSLIMLSIAEKLDMTASEEEIDKFFADNSYGEEEYTEIKETYGMPYLKQFILTQKVFDLIVEKAVTE